MRQAIRRHKSSRFNAPQKILLVVILLSIAYSGFWMVAASRLKQMITFQLDALSEQKGITFNYAKLSMAGYPFRIEVQIHQPKFRMDIASGISNSSPEALDSDTPDTSETPLPPSGQDTQNTPSVPGQNTPSNMVSNKLATSEEALSRGVMVPAADNLSIQPASYEFYTDGTIGISTSMLGQHMRATLEGDGHQLLHHDDKVWHAVLRAKNPLNLDITLHRSFIRNIFLAPANTLNDPATIQSSIEGLHVSAQDISILDGTNNEILRSAESINIQLSNIPFHKSGNALHLDLALKNVVSLPAFDTFYKTLSDGFPDLDALNNLPLPLFSSQSSAYGSINANLDIDLKYPNGLPNPSVGEFFSLNHPLEVVVNRFEVTTGLGAHTLNGSLTVSKGEENTSPLTAHLILHSTHENSEEGYQTELSYLKENLLHNSKAIMPSSSQHALLLEYLKAHPDELADITPKLYEMGKIETNLDIELTNDQSLIVRQADFKTRDYTVKLTGEYHQPDKNSLLKIGGKGKMVFELTNYKQLTADATHYLGRLLAVFNKASAVENPPLIFSDQFKTDLDTLLVLLSDQPEAASNNLAITVKNEGDQFLPTIGTLPLFQAASKAQELLEPHFTPATTPAVPSVPAPGSSSMAPSLSPEVHPAETPAPSPSSPLLHENLP